MIGEIQPKELPTRETGRMGVTESGRFYHTLFIHRLVLGNSSVGHRLASRIDRNRPGEIIPEGGPNRRSSDARPGGDSPEKSSTGSPYEKQPTHGAPAVSATASGASAPQPSLAALVSLVLSALCLAAPSDADAYEVSEELSVGGRIFVDSSWFEPGHNEEGDGPTRNNGVEFRRVRLFAAGTFEEQLAYKLQFDFAGGDAVLKDAYLEFVDVPVVGSIRAGHFKEPFSLELLTSSKYIFFLERATVVGALVPGRNTGIQLARSMLDERLNWQLGAFRITDGFGEFVGGRSAAGTARLTGIPWREGDNLVHLGASYSRRIPQDRRLEDGTSGRFFDPGARPEAHLAPSIVGLPGSGVATDHFDLFGAELASVVGPTSLVAEYIGARLDASDPDAFEDPPILWGWNARGSIFVTGETRPFDSGSGAFSRPKPSRPFLEGGPGAVELLLRYSQVDLRGADGGAFANVTVGTNWYWSRWARMMVNCSFGHPEWAGDDEGEFTQSAQVRLQVDF